MKEGRLQDVCRELCILPYFWCSDSSVLAILKHSPLTLGKSYTIHYSALMCACPSGGHPRVTQVSKWLLTFMDR
jgi:hypothetical protein